MTIQELTTEQLNDAIIRAQGILLNFPQAVQAMQDLQAMGQEKQKRGEKKEKKVEEKK